MNTNIAKTRVVLDTVALISYFSDIFKQESQISHTGISIIDKAFTYENEVLLSIPSIVFVEIFDRWVTDEESGARIKAEVLERILIAPNIEIKRIDSEVLENYLLLNDPNINIENHDKIILASAIMLGWSLITSDSTLIQYVEKHRVIPKVIS